MNIRIFLIPKKDSNIRIRFEIRILLWGFKKKGFEYSNPFFLKSIGVPENKKVSVPRKNVVPDISGWFAFIKWFRFKTDIYCRLKFLNKIFHPTQKPTSSKVLPPPLNFQIDGCDPMLMSQVHVSERRRVPKPYFGTSTEFGKPTQRTSVLVLATISPTVITCWVPL